MEHLWRNQRGTWFMWWTLHVWYIIGSNKTKWKQQYKQIYNITFAAHTFSKQEIRSPGKAQLTFQGCEVSRAKHSADTGPASPQPHHICTPGHTCTAWLYPNKGAFVCLLLAPTLIFASVKCDCGGNKGHFHRISFSLLLLSLLFTSTWWWEAQQF